MEAPSPPLAAPSAAPQSAPVSCWSTIVRKKPPPVPPLPNTVFGDCKSNKGIAVAIVDASAIIHGDKLSGCADKFVSVREVVEEVRDPVSRQRLAHLPFFVETMEPSPEAIKKVVKFARETGDLQTLSDVDIKLIALTYMLDAQIHGTNHLRDIPPQLHVVNVKSLPEAQMPGWGDNVPNLAEWEALEQVAEGKSMGDSRIRPLKDLDDNVIKTTEATAQPTDQPCEHRSVFKPRKYNFPKREIKIEGKKMVADGIDASKGEDVNDFDDWLPAVSRSTHRKYLKRKARRQSRLGAKTNEYPVEEPSTNACTNKVDEAILEDSKGSLDSAKHEVSNNAHIEDEPSMNGNFVENIVCLGFGQISLGADNSEVLQDEEDHAVANIEVEDDHSLIDEDSSDDIHFAVENEDENDICENLSENLEISSNTDGNMNASFFDDASSEQSWKIQSLSDSTVACITSDYAMQNVILQIGLRLLAPGGMQIRQLHRWVLKCHACNNVTREIGKIFCPKCGNGGTLRKVSATVGENGILLATRRQRIILRGTKFSLPLPQGGRDAITKNLILREDQLPRKLLYPKMKKQANNKDEDFLCSDDIFSNVSQKRAPLKPPVRKALALFGGKRNPNDNHFSRKR